LIQWSFTNPLGLCSIPGAETNVGIWGSQRKGFL